MERYETLGLVGEGSYGAVLKCRHRESGRLVAIKKFLDSDDDKTVKKIAQREIKLLRQLRHDNLVNLLEVWKRRRRWYLVFEFVERTLLDELEQHSQGLNLNTCRQYLYQIVRATAFCHQQNVIHRDIKPENILISQGGVVKLCDFGFARTVASPGEGGVYTDYVATRWYRPPELLVGDTHYGKPVDVWAVGCLLLEMLTSQPLFPGESDLDQIYHIVRCFGNLPSQHQELFHRNPLFSGVRLPECSGPVTLEQRFPNAPTAALSLAQSCLQMDPEQRSECSELLEHSFFTHDSFHIRFSDELNAKIQKDHRENSTLPKIPKTTRQAKDEVEEKERQKHHKLPENVDEKLKTKKDKDLSEEKATKSKNKQSSKFPKTSQNAPETSTKPLKTTTKDNAAKTTTPMKTKQGKPTEAQETVKLANTIPSLKTKPSKAPSPEPKQEDLTRVDEVKEATKVTKQAKLAQPEQGQKYLKSYLKTDVKKIDQHSDPQNQNPVTKGFRTTGEQIVIDVMFDAEESNLNAMPKLTKRSHCDTSWQVPKSDTDSNVDKMSKSSQTLETCMSKKSELATNPANSETNSKQKFNQSGMDASVSKEMTTGEAKVLKIPNPSHSLSKIMLQSIQQPAALPKASKNHQEVTSAGNLRMKALTNNFPLERASTVLLGSQQDSGKHLGKVLKGDESSGTAGNGVLETLGRSCKDEASAELDYKTPRLEVATLNQAHLNKQPQVNKVLNKASDKENWEDPVTGEELKASSQANIGNLGRSGSTLVSNKTLKGIPVEAIKTNTNAQRHEAANSEFVINLKITGSDRTDRFEESLRSSPPPPPSSTPLLLPAPAVVTVTGDRSPNNQLRFSESKHHSHIYSRQQQPISSLGPSPLPSTVSERCVSCECSFMSDQSNKRKTDVHLPEVRTSTLLEHKAKDGKGQKPAVSGSEGQPP